MSGRVTVITASTGKKELLRCADSVKNQTYKNVQHLIFADGEDAESKILDLGIMNNHISDTYSRDIIPLPYSVGKRCAWNGHRMYGAGTFLADDNSRYVMFLDDDNYLDPNHIQDCIDMMATEVLWHTHSVR